MGKVSLNALLNGMSGKVGNLVLRQRSGRTIMGQKGVRTAAPTEAMLQHRARFKRAAEYAKISMADPGARDAYAAIARTKVDTSAFNVALADYLRLPTLAGIQSGAYTGAVGDVLVVETADDFKIASVEVSITGAGGTLLESGAAVLADGQWKYTATQANATLAGTRISAKAKDRPGNEVSKEVVL